jgi:hypothetical protein
MLRLAGVLVCTLCAVSLASSRAGVAAASTAPPTPAVAFQLNAAHTGVTEDEMSSARPARRWTVDFSGGVGMR